MTQLSTKLKSRQKRLLYHLVRYCEEKRLDEPFVPFPIATPRTEFVLFIYGQDNFRFKYRSDLDALVDEGWLDFEWNRQGTGKLYKLTKAAITAVHDGTFTATPEPTPQDFTLHDLLQAMSGGLISLPNLEETADLEQIAHDPVKRHKVVNQLCDQLRNTMLPHFPAKQKLAYGKAISALEETLLATRLSEETLLDLAQTLSLHGPITASLPLMLKTWPYLYPLLLIGSYRLSAHSKTR